MRAAASTYEKCSFLHPLRTEIATYFDIIYVRATIVSILLVRLVFTE